MVIGPHLALLYNITALDLGGASVLALFVCGARCGDEHVCGCRQQLR